jgi:flagellar basal-body rod protein FlgF
MGTFVDIAASVLSQAERRVEIAGQNVANISTPGYKRRVAFERFLQSGAQPNATAADIANGDVTPDLAAGKLANTGNPYDLAIAGQAFFTVSVDGRALYTRAGQFQRDADGRLVTAQGFPVQAEGGGDIELKSADFSVQPDGSVLSDGAPVARLGLVQFTDPQAVAFDKSGLFSADDGAVKPAEGALVRQGMLEASNVSMGDEMVAMMAAVRRAETGQRLVSVYDDLMGRVLTAFGQA